VFGIELAELKRPDLLVNLEGRTEFESEAVDDVTALHQEQGRAVQFLEKACFNGRLRVPKLTELLTEIVFDSSERVLNSKH
jgi:hypothetical protein